MNKPSSGWLRELLPDVLLHDVPLPGNAGVDRARLVETGGTLLIAKRLDLGNATVNRLPAPHAECLFGELLATAPKTLVVPVPVNDRFVHRRDGAAIAFFPAIVDPRRTRAGEARPSRRELCDGALRIAKELSQVSVETISGFMEAGLFRNVAHLASERFLTSPAFHALQRVADVTAVLDTLAAAPRSSSLSHGDYHPGNLIRDNEGRIRVIDLDQLALGSPADDLMKVLIWQNATEAEFAGEWRSLEHSLGRSLTGIDAARAIGAFLLWAEENLGRPYRGEPMSPEAFTTGLVAAMGWFRSHWKPEW